MSSTAEETQNQRRAVFFDRDGTLMEEVHYCNDPAAVRVLPGTAEALRELRRQGWLAIVITNQSGIARGRITIEQYEAVHAELLRQLDGHIDATYFCADLPETSSSRRKPEIGMLIEAERDFGIARDKAFFIGDRAADIECGRRAGMKTILVLTGYGCEHVEAGADFVARDVVEAMGIVLRECPAADAAL